MRKEKKEIGFIPRRQSPKQTSTNQLIYQPIHRSINQSIGPSTNPLIHQKINCSIKKSIVPSKNQLIYQPINWSINQSIDQ